MDFVAAVHDLDRKVVLVLDHAIYSLSRFGSQLHGLISARNNRTPGCERLPQIIEIPPRGHIRQIRTEQPAPAAHPMAIPTTSCAWEPGGALARLPRLESFLPC